jgi:hypothetical protein
MSSTARFLRNERTNKQKGTAAAAGDRARPVTSSAGGHEHETRRFDPRTRRHHSIPTLPQTSTERTGFGRGPESLTSARPRAEQGRRPGSGGAPAAAGGRRRGRRRRGGGRWRQPWGARRSRVESLRARQRVGWAAWGRRKGSVT